MKKYLKFGLVASVFMVFGFMGVGVFAQSINSGPGSLSSGNISPMIVNINPKGNVLIRGIVDGAPDSNSIKVKSWGGSWTINIPVTAQLMSANKVIADFQDGDFVGVLGTISSDGSFIVNASIVREWRQKTEHEKIDSDHDGILDNEDLDDDNDSIPDLNESGKSKDHDNDGIPDFTDLDDDDDGIPDITDSHDYDFDNDGVGDSRDDDDDNDGKEDKADSKPHDSDDDGKNNDEDEDDDNDGKDDDEDSDDDDDGKEDSEEDDDNSGSGN